MTTVPRNPMDPAYGDVYSSSPYSREVADAQPAVPQGDEALAARIRALADRWAGNRDLDADWCAQELREALGGAPPRLEVVRIPAGKSLDPVTVFLEDLGPGQGGVTVTCYGEAWACTWGAMGELTVREFVVSVDAGYLAGCLIRGRGSKRQADEAYVVRIASAVILHLDREARR